MRNFPENVSTPIRSQRWPTPGVRCVKSQFQAHEGTFGVIRHGSASGRWPAWTSFERDLQGISDQDFASSRIFAWRSFLTSALGAYSSRDLRAVGVEPRSAALNDERFSFPAYQTLDRTDSHSRRVVFCGREIGYRSRKSNGHVALLRRTKKSAVVHIHLSWTTCQQIAQFLAELVK